MAVVKPLRLKQERVERAQQRAANLPFARVLVDHPVVHLEQIYDYAITEDLSQRALVGSLVEVEFGHSLTQGILLERLDAPAKAGEVKDLRKVLSAQPYLLPGEVLLVLQAAAKYGAKPWDFIRSCIPPYSKMGEREFLAQKSTQSEVAIAPRALPADLQNFLRSKEQIRCAIQLPNSRPYWELCADIALERFRIGTVLILLPNERELMLLEQEFSIRAVKTVNVLSTQSKSQRYLNFQIARTPSPKILLGLRSAALFSLPREGTIILLDDVDESHYERQAPSWNTRDLVSLREASTSVIYASTSLSLEIADRVSSKELAYYRFPGVQPIRIHTASSGEQSGYHALIGKGLKTGSVLISVGAAGYVTTFSCQKCRNIALCTCGGRLYFPARNTHPICSTCQSEFIEWSCTWCGESRPRILGSGVARRAEEFGRAFPRTSVIHSSAQHPVPYLPPGNHIVLSTPGVEPRGVYQVAIFLDLEGRLLRTTLRTTEELRHQLWRTLSMVAPGGDAYLDLPPGDAFLQATLRGNQLLSAEREIEERTAAHLMPQFTNVLISGEPVDYAQKLLSDIPGSTVIGPFLRNGRKSALIKAPKVQENEIVERLQSLNRLQSMRKEGLLTYLIDPYSLN